MPNKLSILKKRWACTLYWFVGTTTSFNVLTCTKFYFVYETRMAPVLIILLLTVTFAANIHAKGKPDPVTVFKRNTGKAIFTKDFPYYSVLIESKESEDYDDHFEEFEFAAKHFGDKVKFIFINTDVEENWETIEYLGLIAEDVPTVLFIDLTTGLSKYKAEFSEITRKNIISFVQDCLDGKSVAFLKSEDIPKNWDEKPLKQLVGKNFEKIVFEQKKTAFVLFYAPWCSACQEALPEIEKLAELFADNKDVLIARMDATTNEVPRIPILDVPTLALFVKGDRKPIYYTDDERTAEAFYKFITTRMEKKESKKEEEVVQEEEKEADERHVGEKKKSERKTTKDEKETATKEKTERKTEKTEKKTEKAGKKTKTSAEDKMEPKEAKGKKSKKDTESKLEKDEKPKKEKEEKEKSKKKQADDATQEKSTKSAKKTTTKKESDEKPKKDAKKSKGDKKSKKDEL
uniref:Protein disulfide-isomerase 2 n=1 Tax=Ascaris suum TaxID=6253 RepID=F1L5F2_ASCSU